MFIGAVTLPNLAYMYDDIELIRLMLEQTSAKADGNGVMSGNVWDMCMDINTDTYMHMRAGLCIGMHRGWRRETDIGCRLNIVHAITV